MSISLSGEWELSVKSKSAAFDQRVVIVGTTNGQDGTYPYASLGTKTLKGAFGIQIQYEKAGKWCDSLMRLGDVSRPGSQLRVEIESDDNVGFGDLDFNDLILEASRSVAANDWCVWGQAKQYSGCFFNPCLLPRLVIDDWFKVAHRIPPEIRIKLEPRVPELAPIGFPDPPPPPDYRATQVEVPPDLANDLAVSSKSSVRRGAFRVPGLKSLSSAMSETVNAAGAVASQTEVLSSDLLARIRTRCSINPAPGVVLRVIDYDPGPGETTGQLFPGTGHLEVLGHVVTDDWGFYLFCFEWPYGTTGLLKPDVMLQLIQDDDEGVPNVTLQSHISWNIDNLYRKDFCIPGHLLDEKPTDDVVDPARIFQYVGNLPVVRIATSGLSDGHATSETGDLVSVKRAPFAKGLYLKGSFHDYPSVKYYRINYWTTDNPDGNIASTPLLTPLRYYNADFDLITVGPGPLIFPGVPAEAYPVMDGNYNFSHPFGRQYLALIDTRSLKTGKMKTGYLHIQVQGLDTTGSDVTGAFDQMKLRIDDVAPVPEIEPITAGSGAGAGCGFITLNNPSDTFPLTYRVTDDEGHLYKYYFRLFKCHNNQIGGNHYSPVYDLTFPVHWYGTEDDPTSTVPTLPDISGWVTVPMPNGGQLITPAEIAGGINFVAVSIELWAVSRSTDGRHNHLHWPRYVEVIGVKYEPAP